MMEFGGVANTLRPTPSFAHRQGGVAAPDLSSRNGIIGHDRLGGAQAVDGGADDAAGVAGALAELLARRIVHQGFAIESPLESLSESEATR